MSVKIENQEGVLSTRVSANRLQGYFVLGVGIVFLVIFFYQPAFVSLAAGTIALWGGLYLLWNEREFVCTFNKQTGEFIYFQGGVLGSLLGARTTQYAISEVTAIEKKQYFVRRDPNTFQVFILINNLERLRVSGQHLSFRECEELAGKIHKFLGDEVSLVALE